MARYLKLYAYFLRFSFSRAMEFRMDFFFRIVMDLFYYLVNIAFFRLVFLHTSVLGGWNEAQAMVFVSGYLVVDGIVMTVFSNNLYSLPSSVNKGDLDYYLVRPVSTLFFVSLRDFAANSFVNLLMALGIAYWAIHRYPEPVSAVGVLGYAGMLGLGVLLYYMLRMFFILPIFWTHSGRGLEQVFWGLTRIMERPDRIFTGWVRRLFTTILPFSLMASFPARVFLEAFDPWILVHLLAVMLVFAVGLRLFWRSALRAYSSASS